MKLISYAQSNLISTSESAQWNCSDGIVIPSAIKTPIKDRENASYCLKNKEGQKAYVYCVANHSLDTETIIVPQWVMNVLRANTMAVSLSTCVLDVATRIGVRLYSKELQKHELYNGLLKYKHMQANTIVPILVRDKEILIKIEKTSPNKEFVTLRGANVFFEFLEQTDAFIPFYGLQAYTIGGIKQEGKTQKELVREAALRRLAASQQVVP